MFIGGGGRGGIMGGEKFVDRIGNISNNGL